VYLAHVGPIISTANCALKNVTRSEKEKHNLVLHSTSITKEPIPKTQGRSEGGVLFYDYMSSVFLWRRPFQIKSFNIHGPICTLHNIKCASHVKLGRLAQWWGGQGVWSAPRTSWPSPLWTASSTPPSVAGYQASTVSVVRLVGWGGGAPWASDLQIGHHGSYVRIN
jgi:hypothetical protein